MTLEEVVAALYSHDAEAIVVDIVSATNVEEWWTDDGFSSSPFTKNGHHAGIVATSITLGQLQRETNKALAIKTAEYFALASRVNAGLRKTKFVRLFTEHLAATPLTRGTEYPAEYLLATRRVYEPHDAPHNFAPHCDDLTYARDPGRWPEVEEVPNQLGAFLTIQGSNNNAGMLIWDHRPASRAELDVMHEQYKSHGEMPSLAKASNILLKPDPGQLTVFRSKNMHAIERCNSLRRTMGLFLVKRGSWRLFD